MSRKLMSVLVTLGLLSCVAIALTVTAADFATIVGHRYPTKADFDWVTRPNFDWAFAEVETASALDPERAAAEREKIRLAVLKQMNLSQFSE